MISTNRTGYPGHGQADKDARCSVVEREGKHGDVSPTFAQLSRNEFNALNV